MGRKATVAISCLTVAAAAGWYLGRGRASAAEPSGAQPARQRVELTVYPTDFGMVRERRPVQLAAGANRLRLPDVSRQLDPESVLLDWPDGTGGSAEIVAHAYDLGVASGDALLKRYLGHTVEVVRYGDNGREAERQSGTLAVTANGEVVLQTDGKFIVHPPGTILAPAGGDIVTVPQLSVQAESPRAQSATLDLAYLTRGLSWTADYVATLSPKTDAVRLQCFATVINRTGVDYPNAAVSLVAGEPNRAARTADDEAPESRPYASMANHFTERGLMAKTMAGRQPQAATPPVAAGEGYVYGIKAPTTIAQEQMNRLLIVEGPAVPIVRDYSTHLPVLYAYDYYDEAWGTPARPARGTVQAAFSFYNRKKDGLGEPLPGGDMRVYEPDAARTLRYAGAAAVPDTPNDQKVSVTLARAFDLFTEARLLKRQRVDRHTVRKSVEVVVHNEKAVPAAVRAVQSFGGRWKMVAESAKHANLDANTAQWAITVPAHSTTKLTYSVNLGG